MKEIKTDKELLAEIIAWGEKAVSAAGNRYSRVKPDLEATQRVRDAYTTLRVAVGDAEKTGVKFYSEKLIKDAKLGTPEIQIFYICLYYQLVERTSPSVQSIIRAISDINDLPAAAAAAIFHPDTPLFKGKILYANGKVFPTNVDVFGFYLQKLMGINPKKKAAVKQDNQKITPKQIYEKLSDSVIGQEAAKKRVSSALFRHLKACHLNLSREPHERIQKANILVIGPTGTGKTHIARTLSTILNVPFSSCDSTQYTESGYVGMNVEEMLMQLYKASGNSHERMQNGIIYIDEIDKIAARDSRSGHNVVKDVSGLSVQQELLKMLDGDKIIYTKRGAYGETEYEFKVGGILFVAGGAFMGLEEIVKDRLNRKAAIGFSGSMEAAKANESLKDDNWLSHLITEDLIEYGFIPEFIGRFASIVTLNALSLGDVEDILTKPKNSLLSQYNDILKEAGINHKFTPAELKAVAEEAFALKTGARGLKAIMEARTAPLLFEGGQPEKSKPEAKKSHKPNHGRKAA